MKGRKEIDKQKINDIKVVDSSQYEMRNRVLSWRCMTIRVDDRI